MNTRRVSLGGNVVNRRSKKLFFIAALIGIALFLSGCTQVNEPIDASSTGVWNKVFVYPMSQAITFFAELFNGSYGLAIIIVTILIRTLLMPLYVKQIRSSKAMQDIQPEIKKLQEKYSSKDANTQRKLQEEQLALFQKHGVNPLAGCLPAFFQMPILIAIYHAIMRTTAIKTGSFLWFELGAPNTILALVAGATTFIQQKIIMADTPQPAQGGPNPMAMMLYIMPVMIIVFAMALPAALPLYWIVGNVFMIAQTLLIRKPLMNEANTGGGTK